MIIVTLTGVGRGRWLLIVDWHTVDHSIAAVSAVAAVTVLLTRNFCIRSLSVLVHVGQLCVFVQQCDEEAASVLVMR